MEYNYWLLKVYAVLAGIGLLMGIIWVIQRRWELGMPMLFFCSGTWIWWMLFLDKIDLLTSAWTGLAGMVIWIFIVGFGIDFCKRRWPEAQPQAVPPAI